MYVSFFRFSTLASAFDPFWYGFTMLVRLGDLNQQIVDFMQVQAYLFETTKDGTNENS